MIKKEILINSNETQIRSKNVKRKKIKKSTEIRNKREIKNRIKERIKRN
jgi:hypothetical protein